MTTKRILIALAILLLAALAYWALDTYVSLTREPACDPATAYSFCMNIKKDYAGATATIEAQQ